MDQKISPEARLKNRTVSEPVNVRPLKVPEALPGEQVKESALSRIKSAVFRKKTAIQSIVREPTSGGIVFRLDRKSVV